tara:strand:- start:62 stop:436 length:375 start_codon:yes stop_codon:yes gene_type:complete
MSTYTYFDYKIPPIDCSDAEFDFHPFAGGWDEKLHRNIDWSSLNSGKNNPMYGSKRAGTFSKECLEKKRQSMLGKNSCRVQIHGIVYPSIADAESTHPNVKVRYRIDNPKYSDWIRLDPITHRK